MGRPGGNSGKGGRNYRLNWKDHDGVSRYSKWSIHLNSAGKAVICFDGQPMTGTRSFASVENAKRRVEKMIRKAKL